MLFDFNSMAFKSFGLEVANRKPLSTKPAIVRIGISRWEGMIFYDSKILYPKLLHNENFVSFEEQCTKNHMKLVLNTSTWHFLNHLQFINVGKIKVMDLTWALVLIWCSNLYNYLFIHLCERKKASLYFLHWLYIWS